MRSGWEQPELGQWNMEKAYGWTDHRAIDRGRNSGPGIGSDVVRRAIWVPLHSPAMPSSRARPTPEPDRVGEEIVAAQRELHDAIRAKDRPALEDLHDEEFFAAELPGLLISAEDHIETAMNAGDLELKPFDIVVKGFGDLAVEWNKQTLKGRLDPSDPGTSPAVAAAVLDGVVFSCLTVWRRRDGKWRLLSYQATILDEDAGADP